MKDITDDNFEQEVIQSTKPVLVDFWAPWCGPCRMLSPTLEAISNSEKNAWVKVVKMNIDDNTQTPSKFAVRSIPTMMIFKDGKSIDTKIGVHSQEVIEDWMTSQLI